MYMAYIYIPYIYTVSSACYGSTSFINLIETLMTTNATK